MNAELIAHLKKAEVSGDLLLPASLAPELRELKLPQWAQVKLATLRISLLTSLRALSKEGDQP